MDLNTTKECNDGNTVDGDGCSSTCKTEEGFACSGGGMLTRSFCFRNETMELKLGLIEIIQNQIHLLVNTDLTTSRVLVDETNCALEMRVCRLSTSNSIYQSLESNGDLDLIRGHCKRSNSTL